MKKATIISKAIASYKNLYADKVSTERAINDILKAFCKRHKKATLVFGIITAVIVVLQISIVVINALNESKKSKQTAVEFDDEPANDDEYDERANDDEHDETSYEMISIK